ncbi:hypothetical protein BDK51DRAFT_26188 [Blyttiomyces helicus]|uniref:Secreted protein n=1 Tax=Blyttiomyces helicus TaxID=388810 RepID=A0A4P9WHD3_9FUNG|nr:hypothetical protein BDK51DRAFT_26188 [Blyttiomyces helicus]|eukprot:RKO92241.1 hypothetical protein BDK51DRAFT_26188 [Blyttiomyces helicus]
MIASALIATIALVATVAARMSLHRSYPLSPSKPKVEQPAWGGDGEPCGYENRHYCISVIGNYGGSYNTPNYDSPKPTNDSYKPTCDAYKPSHNSYKPTYDSYKHAYDSYKPTY